MENQSQSQPQSQPQFTIAELGAKFGASLAQTFSEIITLEKIIKSQQRQIQAMVENEARFADHIQDLENELALLKSENYELQQAQPLKLSPEAAKYAAQGKAIINEVQVTDGADTKEKAADEGGYVESPFNVTRTIQPG